MLFTQVVWHCLTKRQFTIDFLFIPLPTVIRNSTLADENVKRLYINPLKTIWFCYNTHFPLTPAGVYSGTSLQQVNKHIHWLLMSPNTLLHKKLFLNSNIIPESSQYSDGLKALQLKYKYNFICKTGSWHIIGQCIFWVCTKRSLMLWNSLLVLNEG